MSIPSSGAISFSTLQSTLGGGNPVSMSEYYKNGSVPYTRYATNGKNRGVAINVSDLRGASQDAFLFRDSVTTSPMNAYGTGIIFQVSASSPICIERLSCHFYINSVVPQNISVYYRLGDIMDTGSLTNSSLYTSLGTSPITITTTGIRQIPINLGIVLNSGQSAVIAVFLSLVGTSSGTYAFGNFAGNGTAGQLTTNVTAGEFRLRRGYTFDDTNFPINTNVLNGVDFAGRITYIPLNMYQFTTHTFTNASATGRTGPTLNACVAAYTASSQAWVSNTSYFNMTIQGVQIWTVPIPGRYNITIAGARSGTMYNGGGLGVVMTINNVGLPYNSKLIIIVGQMGTRSGGGGGTFVFLNSVSVGNLLFVAGGGGGSGYNAYNGYVNSNVYGDNGQLSNNGSSGGSSTYGGGNGGTSGFPGDGANGSSANGYQGGFGTGGDLTVTSNFTINTGGAGGGGVYGISSSTTFVGGNGYSPGGFGAGGASAISNSSGNGWGIGGGGGGGYSGGGGGAGGATDNESGAKGGGGGSYYNPSYGTFSTWVANNNGHGYAAITMV
jgi:hypothetical protein